MSLTLVPTLALAGVVGVAGIPRFLAARLSLPSFFHFAFVGRRRLTHAFVVVFFVLGVL